MNLVRGKIETSALQQALESSTTSAKLALAEVSHIQRIGTDHSLRTMPGQLNLLFVRHGETQDNIDRILQGQRDTNLTEKGHEEAKVLASELQDLNINAIYHSDLTRMLQTIAPLLDQNPNLTAISDPELRGQALGELEGKSYDDINLASPRSADGQPGVECFDDFVQRLKRALARIIGAEAPLVSGSGDRNVVIATHGVGITSLLKTLEATPHCEKFNPVLAERGPRAFEVRWTESDDVAKVVVLRPEDLPIDERGRLVYEEVSGRPFVIERWGKEKNAIDPSYYSGSAGR